MRVFSKVALPANASLSQSADSSSGLRGISGTAIRGNDAGPFSCQGNRECPADTTGRAGYDGNAIFQSHPGRPVITKPKEPSNAKLNELSLADIVFSSRIIYGLAELIVTRLDAVRVLVNCG